MRVRITDFGRRIVSVEVPDRSGNLDHVVVGFDDTSEYESARVRSECYSDASPIGRGGGAFTLDRYSYPLSNNEEHATYGGRQGFDKLLWGSTTPATRTYYSLW